jgi:hypothetical protein
MQRAMSSAAMPYSFRTASRSLGQAAEAASVSDGFLRLSGLPRRPFAHSHSHSSSTASASGTCTPSLSRSLSPSSSITSSFTIATAPSIPAASLAGKSKTRLSNIDRKRICEFANEHPELRQETVGTHFGVERSTVSKILKEKEKWLNIDEEREGHIVKHRCVARAAEDVVITGLLTVSSTSNARFPKIEIVLTGWIQANGGPLSDRTLMEKAAAIAREQGETTFRASAGWVVKFRERLRRNTGIGSPIAPRVPSSSAAPTPSPIGTSSLGRIPAPSPAGPPAAPLGAVLNEHDARRAALEQADQQGLSASAAAAAAEAAAASAAQARTAANADSIAAHGQITPRAAKRRADLMLQGALPMPSTHEQLSKRLRSRTSTGPGGRTSTPPYTSSGSSGSGMRNDDRSSMQHMQSHDDTHMQSMASMLGPAFEQQAPHGTYGHAEMQAISPEQHGQPLKDVAANSLGLAAAGYTAASPNPFAPPRELGNGARLSHSLSGTNGDSTFDTSTSACTHDDSGVAGLVSVSSTSSPGGGNERMDDGEASPCHSSAGCRSSEQPVTVHEAQRSVDTIIRFLREHPNMARRDEEFLLWGQLKGYLNATLEIENQNGAAAGREDQQNATPRIGN